MESPLVYADQFEVVLPEKTRLQRSVSDRERFARVQSARDQRYGATLHIRNSLTQVSAHSAGRLAARVRSLGAHHRQGHQRRAQQLRQQYHRHEYEQQWQQLQQQLCE